MIIVRLTGGLGNQLFQYAFGRALSEKTGQRLYFDAEIFNKKKGIRRYELNKFAREPNCSIPLYIRILISLRHIAKRFLKKVDQIGPVRFYDESHIFCFDEQVVYKCRAGIDYYDGYWQSPLYFNDIRSLLLKDLKLKLPPSSLSLSLSEVMQKENAVSIHVRRGDYVTSSHGLCSIEYYQQAVDLFVKEEKEVSFYIFSDDIPWTKTNLKIDQAPVHYVEHTSDLINYEDLHLMSICKHNIIANSSFSWWGAWLNEHPLKQVIAPKNWGIDGFDTLDLIPKEWIRL